MVFHARRHHGQHRRQGSALAHWCAQEAVLKADGGADLDALADIRLCGDHAWFGGRCWWLCSPDITDRVGSLARRVVCTPGGEVRLPVTSTHYFQVSRPTSLLIA